MRREKYYTIIAVAMFLLCGVFNATAQTKVWWIGVTSQGELMPIGDGYAVDMIDDTHGNQVQPLLLSNQGDVIWSEEPFSLVVKDSEVVITESRGEIFNKKVGETLKDAYCYASQNFFPPSGVMPHELLVSAPQYNTWIELMYDQNQADILTYAHAIIDNGYPAGVLMIDDCWQEDYGKWNFHPARFPDPKAMMDELHGLGFKVMLWVCPFVSADCDVYRALAAEGAFLTSPKIEGESNLPTFDNRGYDMPQPVVWWNGFSALLDLTAPAAEQWFKGELDKLQREYGVDGFKFDAGDALYYKVGVSRGGVSANTQSELFAKVGLDYPLNEYRATWKMGGEPLVQRLRDKDHTWEDLRKLIPSMALQSMMGYYFNCPDMIGGGNYTSFLSLSSIDQELIVRSAQCHALMPMMQFSVAPWRILDQTHQDAVKSAVDLRGEYADYILEQVRLSASTGIPALRPVEFNYPNSLDCVQHFMIGDKLYVAPIVEAGVQSIDIKLPSGRWKAFDGKMYKGGKELSFDVTLDDIPYFWKIN